MQTVERIVADAARDAKRYNPTVEQINEARRIVSSVMTNEMDGVTAEQVALVHAAYAAGLGHGSIDADDIETPMVRAKRRVELERRVRELERAFGVSRAAPEGDDGGGGGNAGGPPQAGGNVESSR